MKTYNELPQMISDLYLSNCNQVEDYFEGEKLANQFFTECGIEGTVSVNEIKSIMTFDEDRNITVKTKIYECYVDSGSVDYFHFYYDVEL